MRKYSKSRRSTGQARLRCLRQPSKAAVADTDELFRTKHIPEIRAAKGATRREISAKEELRQLIGRSYHDLIDSAGSNLLIKQSSDSISNNLSCISSNGNLQINSSKSNMFNQ